MRALMVAALMGAFAAAAPAAPAAAQTVERLYVMDCGRNAATDQARWSPGVNVGKPIELSDTCYLIKHGGQWLLWDTGYPDSLADKPVTNAIGTASRPKKLAAQLAEIHVKFNDITMVAVSHTPWMRAIDTPDEQVPGTGAFGDETQVTALDPTKTPGSAPKP